MISSLSPTLGPVGTSVTITGSNFTPTGNKIKFGNQGTEYNPRYSLDSSDGATLVFTVPSSNYYACQFNTYGIICSPPNYLTLPGVYAVSVTNSNRTSNMLNFTVTSQ